MKYIWIFLIMAGCLFATFSKSEAQIFGPRIHHHYHYTPYYQPYQPYYPYYPYVYPAPVFLDYRYIYNVPGFYYR